jgi:pyruvate/2-oxoglutarate dehydrogenase complex dihydrolipoamide dehydrogenase (E3) component
MYDVLVIGGGPAGVTAALRARELGAKVALVERGRMGGTCTNDGCVPTRVLAKAARLVREAEQFDEYGLIAPPPEVNFERLMQRVQQVVYQIHEKKQLIGHLEQAGVTVIVDAGEAKFEDPHTIVLPDGRKLQAEKFILAAGGRSRKIVFPGSDLALTHHDVWSLRKQPASMIMVGASATGCQVASIFDAFGTKMTLLEVSPRILRTEDELVSNEITRVFRERGMEVITGVQGIERIEKSENGLRLWYTDQGQSVSIEAEAVTLATGWPGNADLLNLAAAGVESERGYVKVNDYLQSSAPHIFAAGDITGRMMLVQSAGYEARAAAENAVLGVGQPNRHRIVPHGGFTDPEYASVGLTEEKAREVPGGYLSTVIEYAELDRAVIDGHPVGFCKLIVSQENHRILGAHIVGEQALEIVQLVAAAMEGDMLVEQLSELEIAYPTYTSIVGLAARKLIRDLGVMALAPEWHALSRVIISEWEHRIK